MMKFLILKLDIVIVAITGAVGLLPVVSVLNKGITLALANKESLVCSGMLVTKIAKEKECKDPTNRF